MHFCQILAPFPVFVILNENVLGMFLAVMLFSVLGGVGVAKEPVVSDQILVECLLLASCCNGPGTAKQKDKPIGSFKN